MRPFKLAQILTVLLATGPALADEPGNSRLRQRGAVADELAGDPVREWNTPYTLDIPADLGRGRGGGNFITYAPNYGQPGDGTRPGATAPTRLCPNRQVLVAGLGCRPALAGRERIQ